MCLLTPGDNLVPCHSKVIIDCVIMADQFTLNAEHTTNWAEGVEELKVSLNIMGRDNTRSRAARARI